MTILEDLENLFYGRTPPTDVEIQSALRDWKNSVRVATTAALTLATDLEAGDTLDGITLAEGDRVLVKDQASGIENGIYNVSASGAPSRASDMEATTDAAGVIVLVLEGSTQADTMWLCSDDSFTEVGVDAITFIPFLPSGAGIDTDAIHQSVANEINSLTLKATPVAADRIVIEDSEASWAKKTTPLSALPALGTTPTHASNHVTGGSDEIDGDKVDIDWDPSNYTPTTSPSEADSVDNLTAHLAGIDAKLAGGAGSFVAQDGSGNASVSGTLNSAGDFTVATNKLTVDATTGNTSVAGTLGSTGDLAVNTDKFVVTATTGAVSAADGNFTVASTGAVQAAGGAYAVDENGEVDALSVGVTGGATLTDNGIAYPVNKPFGITQVGPAADEVASALNIYAGGGGAASAGAGKDGAALALRGGFGGDGATGLAPGDGGAVNITGGAGGATNDTGLSNGGDINLNGGAANEGSDGSINLGVTTAKAINSGSGSTPWTHAGPLYALLDGETNANTSITAADSMNGKCIYCTAGTAVTFTVGDSLSTEVWFLVAQWGAGQVSFAASGSVNLRKASVFNAATAEQYSYVLVHCKASASETGLTGDLELA